MPIHFTFHMVIANMAVTMLLTNVCGHSVCRNTDTQHADHRQAAHSAVFVDRRTQTLHTRKTSRRLAATHNAERRPQRSQLSFATGGRSADGERHTGKVT